MDVLIPVNAAAALSAAFFLSRHLMRPRLIPPVKFILGLMVASLTVIGGAYAAALFGLFTLTSMQSVTRPAAGLLFSSLAAAAYLGGDYRHGH